jgi:hypothetical protein
MHDAAQMDFLGCDQRKSFLQVKSHLPTENGDSSSTGPIILPSALVAHVPQQLEVLTHFQSPA